MKKAILGLVVILTVFTSMFSLLIVKRKYVFSNQKFYTDQELKNEYQKGYDTGSEENRDEALYIKLQDLQLQKLKLEKENEQYVAEIETLNSSITNLQTIKAENEVTIKSLQDTITENEKSISDLTIEKNKLQNKVNELNSEIETLKSSSDSEKKTLQNLINSKTAQIESLNNQITTLQANISQLQETNRLNTNTITSLNTQIANLNSQISDMTLASQNSTSRINALTNKINQLQESITYYENFIAQLENEEKVVATFEYDGSVYNIQIVSKGSIVTVTAPTATEDKIFNGWTVNGELVDLSTYTINSNTKFIADITYKQKVVFKTDTETTYNTQHIVKGQYATLPTAPTKAGYEFDGWSINGVDIIENIETTAVNEDTTYIAVFTKLHSVTFLYESETKSSQQVRNGSYATNVNVEDTTYKIFNGWKINGTLVDILTYKIVADTTFVAAITYKYDVKFMVDETEYNSQIVTAGSYPTLPTAPTKDGYTFKGWSIDGTNVVENVETTAVNSNVTYIAVFIVSNYNVKFYVDDFEYNSQIITSGSFITIPESPTKNYYEFLGWSIDKISVIDNIENIDVSSDMNFYAIFNSIPLIDISKSRRYKLNNTEVCYVIPYIDKTVIRCVNDFKLDNATITMYSADLSEIQSQNLSNNEPTYFAAAKPSGIASSGFNRISDKDYVKLNVSQTKLLGPNKVESIVNAHHFINSDIQSDRYNIKCYFDGDAICYEINIPVADWGMTVTVASKVNILDYCLFYTLNENDTPTNQVNLMSKCITTKTINDSSSTIILPNSDDESIIGWAIFTDEPYKEYSDYTDDINSNSLTYLGDCGATVDLSLYRHNYVIRIFAVYRTT